MRNGLFRLFIFILVLLTAVSSEVPLVLCFGEDGHIRFEMAGVDPIHHLTEPLLDENNIPPGRWDMDKESCGNCLDLPFFSFRFINEKTLIAQISRPNTSPILPPNSWRLIANSTFERNNQYVPPFLISSFNSTLQHIILLI